MSIYQNKVFADYWNERVGDEGEVYKKFVLDPLLFREIGDISGAVVLELGCGNGYLARRFLDGGVEHLKLLDVSQHNLDNAARKVNSPKVSFLLQDATHSWHMADHSIDIIYSNMMLNEVADIGAVCREAYRVLKSNGRFAFSVTHPCWDMYVYAQAQSGVEPRKIKGLGGYFRRGYAKFVMGTDDPSSEHTKKRRQTFEVEHYQRPIGDYFAAVSEAGFTVRRFIEPELTKKLLDAAPRFVDYADRPISLVLLCEKT